MQIFYYYLSYMISICYHIHIFFTAYIELTDNAWMLAMLSEYILVITELFVFVIIFTS